MALTIVCALALGCSSPSRDLMPLPLAPNTSSIVSVVSGWDGAPVAGATLVLDGETFRTNAAGYAELPPPSQQPLDIDAAGFLPRRTRHRRSPITLWPAASEEEATVIRDMLHFPQRDGTYALVRPSSLVVQVNTTHLMVDQAISANARAAEAFTTLRQLGVRLTKVDRLVGDDNEIQITFSDNPEECSRAWGFCSYWPGLDLYFTYGILVAPGFESRPDAIVRGILSVLMRPEATNPFPGLMNRDDPARELSLLEQQAIKMAYLRAPLTRWPDTDTDRLGGN